MSPSRAYYVTACQQVLALGVVVIALVPATRVVTLDVVGVHPGAERGPSLVVPDVAVSEGASAKPQRARSPRVAEWRASVREERGALHRGDVGQAGVVGAGHQDQRAR